MKSEIDHIDGITDRVILFLVRFSIHPTFLSWDPVGSWIQLCFFVTISNGILDFTKRFSVGYNTDLGGSHADPSLGSTKMAITHRETPVDPSTSVVAHLHPYHVPQPPVNLPTLPTARHYHTSQPPLPAAHWHSYHTPQPCRPATLAAAGATSASLSAMWRLRYWPPARGEPPLR